MTFVLDASAVVRALAYDEPALAERADDLLVRAFTGSAVVPGHWHVEVVQAAAGGVRSGRWSPEWARGMIATARALEVAVIADAEDAARLFDDALAWDLTAQDAAYLRLARDLGLPLATADAALRRAAERIGVACL
ncbi:MAG: type II toxin-antitoxin system VapC family toxin [Actinomycetota bacterium]